MKKKIINETVTKKEVRDIVKQEIESLLKQRKFEKKVKELSIDVIDDLYYTMYTKKSFWKNNLKT